MFEELWSSKCILLLWKKKKKKERRYTNVAYVIYASMKMETWL